MKFTDAMIRYQLTEQEVIRSWLKHRRHRTQWQLRMALVAIGLLMMAYCRKLPTERTGTAFISAVGFTALTLFLCLQMPWDIRRSYTKAVRNNPVHTEPKQASFDADGISLSSTTSSGSFKWAVFKKITEDGRYFYLHINNAGSVALLPKRAFDEAGMENFRRCSQSVPRA